MSESGWQTWRDHPAAARQHFKLTLTDFDMQRMDRERLEMIEAGLWLIEQAFSEQPREARRSKVSPATQV